MSLVQVHGGYDGEIGAGLVIISAYQEYVGILTMGLDDNDLIDSFTFSWNNIKIDYADADDRDIVNIEDPVDLAAQETYNAIINGEYNVGVTPFKTTTITSSDGETSTISFVIGWAHGDIGRPSFSLDSSVSSVSYSPDELESLEEQYAKDDIGTSLQSTVASIATNIYNRMNLTTNQDLDFQKNKKKQIGFKNISKYETLQEKTQVTSTSATSIVTTVGGY
jgi:hypothetical protein